MTRITRSSFRLLMMIVAGSLVSAVTAAQPQEARSDPSGDAETGQALFTTYKCYACHGYGGQTGSPRLVPMRLEEAAFLRVVSVGSATGAMPSYADAPVESLEHIYAYIRSIPPDTTAASDIPLLHAILEEIEEQK